jgi:hypothetical protein
MKTSFFIAALLLLTCSLGYCQSPVPDADTVKDPIKQGDPAPQIIQPRVSYKKTMVSIKPSQVPAPVKKRLAHSAYKGWEKATIYRNESSTLYLVEFQESGKTRTYRFDKNGQQLEDDDQ